MTQYFFVLLPTPRCPSPDLGYPNGSYLCIIRDVFQNTFRRKEGDAVPPASVGQGKDYKSNQANLSMSVWSQSRCANSTTKFHKLYISDRR